MQRVSFLILFFVITCSLCAQDQKIMEINNRITLIDQAAQTSAFKESSFEDDYGNNTDIKAFFNNSELLKIEASSRSLNDRVVKSYYFLNAELILVDEITLVHPGLANWEEAKSNDLGEEEIKRVQNVVREERRFYLDGWVVIKCLPEGVLSPEAYGRKLNLEARDLLGRLQ